MPTVDDDHYCIQAERIAKMDEKLDDLTGHFHIGGVIWEMSGNIKKLTNGKKEENRELPTKWLIWAVLGLVAILATLFGIKMPF